jgi:hypothetical protein
MAGKPIPVPPTTGGGPRNATELAIAQGKFVATPNPPLQTSETVARQVTKDDSAQPRTNNQQPLPSQPLSTDYWNRFSIKPQPNILDEYASYSYSASVYLITTDQYVQLLESGKKSVAGYQLLFQSGGAQANFSGTVEVSVPGGEAATTTTNDGLNRSKYFSDDFYIDSITVENEVPGKATGAAHMITNLNFTVVEPNGITLLDRLALAVANFRPPELQGKAVNYANALYLMVIRFYGYDKNGQQVTVTGSTVDVEGVSQPGAVVERFIPFQIKNIKFGIGNQLVSYNWECSVIGQLKANFVGRGTVPADIELASKSVGDILGGIIGDASSPSPPPTAINRQGSFRGTNSPAQPGATTTTNNNQVSSDGRSSQTSASTWNPQQPFALAAPTNVATSNRSLVKALNDYQQQLVKEGIFQFPDIYEIRFIGDDAAELFGSQLALLDKDIIKKRTASATPAASNLNPDKGYIDLKTRSYPIVAGMSIVQVLDLLIRNSTWISKQSLVAYDENGRQIPNENRKNSPLKWFNISMHAVPLQFDEKRNDNAYRIVYSIASRLVKNVVSRYFVSPAFTGVVKRYPYWFTGKNVAVLDYKEELNTMFQFTVSGGRTSANVETESVRDNALAASTNSLLDIASYVYSPRSTENSAGGSGPQLEPAANFAELLYNPGDLREVTMRIVGDPAWIAQGSVLRAPNNQMFSGVSVAEGFLADGTIALENQEVLFEVAWQKPADYNIATGLADPYLSDPTRNRNPFQSRVHVVKKITSEFRQGKFEQVLTGSAYVIDTDSLLRGSVTVGPITATNAATLSQAQGKTLPNTNAVQRENANQNAINNSASTRGGAYYNGASGPQTPGGYGRFYDDSPTPATRSLPITTTAPPAPPTDGANNTVGSTTTGATDQPATPSATSSYYQRMAKEA